MHVITKIINEHNANSKIETVRTTDLQASTRYHVHTHARVYFIRSDKIIILYCLMTVNYAISGLSCTESILLSQASAVIV